MRAVLVEEDTKKLYIGEAERPSIMDNELLVKVKATAINRADLLQRTGNYPPPKGASPILGLEMSGVVEEVGKNAGNWKKGDPVFGLLPGGGYAEYAKIPGEMAIPIPESLSFEQAAAIPEVFLTAYLNMFKLGGLTKGGKVLIHAGASGVGTAAIQLAREAGAASIIVTAGTETKREFCLALGADVAIDYKEGPFAPKVKEATEEKGVNLILDFIGAPYWEQNISSLDIDGRLILIGTMGGSKVNDVDLGKLLFKRIQVIGTALRSKPVDQKVDLTKRFSEFALPLFNDGHLKPIIDSVMDWQQANEAHNYMEQNKNSGKIVLQIK